MKNNKFEKATNNITIIRPPQMNDAEKECVKKYAYSQNDFLEIIELFRLYDFAFEELKSVFILDGNDKLKKIRYKRSNYTDLQIINSLTINFISLGVSFINALEAYLKNNLNDKKFNDFKKKYISDTYDKCFSYRLCDFLRNYSQHSHVIVSQDTNGFCFDIKRLATNIHFNYKQIIEKEMKDFIKKLIIKVGCYPMVSYSFTIIEYRKCILEIYQAFLNFIEDDMVKKYTSFNKCISDNASIICKSDDQEFDNTVIIDVDDNLVNYLKLGLDITKIHLSEKKHLATLLKENEKNIVKVGKSFYTNDALSKVYDDKVVIMNNKK